MNRFLIAERDIREIFAKCMRKRERGFRTPFELR